MAIHNVIRRCLFRICLLNALQSFIVCEKINCTYESPVYTSTTPMSDMYLDLLQNVATGLVYGSHQARTLYHNLGSREHLRPHYLNVEQRVCGMDLPKYGVTMVGIRRLYMLRKAIENVVRSNIPGDIIECGVWEGGASAYALAVLKVLEKTPNRRVWLADSFSGFPRNPILYDAETLGLPLNGWESAFVKVAQVTVENNLRNLNLLDPKRTKFLKGYFSETLPRARMEIGDISVLRMDGDMYESSMDILYNLYPIISDGGWVIIDDWWLENCQKAIIHFRTKFHIDEPIKMIDFSSAYWIKTKQINGINLTDWEIEKSGMKKAGKRTGIFSVILSTFKIFLYLCKTLILGGQSGFMPNSVEA